MTLNQKRKEQIFNLLAKLPDSEWDKLERIVTEQLQPKELEIHTYLQKLYEDDKFRLIANFEDGTDKKLDFIEFTDKRENTFKEQVWDNDAWWDGMIDNDPKSTSQLDMELLPIVQQFLRQILMPK